GNPEVAFLTALLGVRIDLGLGRIDQAAAAVALTELLESWTGDTEQAAIYYELWRLDLQNEAARQASESRYRALAAETGNIEFVERLRELTGESQDDPPPLPNLPRIVPAEEINLDRLLELVSALGSP
ncbi:MAG: hypothetical protein AAF633_25680, partial [Chloroflexota bacterium]